KPPGKKRGVLVERLPRVEVVHPVRKRIVRRLETSATVEALKKVDVSARVPGIVRDLDDKMDIGRTVKQGEVLLRLAVPERRPDGAAKDARHEEGKKQESLALASLEVARREVDESKAEAKRFKADVEYHKDRSSRISNLVRQNAQDAQLAQEAQKLLA